MRQTSSSTALLTTAADVLNVSIGDAVRAPAGECPHAHLQYQGVSWLPAPSPWIRDARVYSVKDR